MAVQWGLLGGQTDSGTAFQQSYQNALLQREHQQDRAIEQQQRQQQLEMQREQVNVQGRERKLTQYHAQIIRGAGIARDVEHRLGRPMDEAGWQEVRAAAQTAGIDLTDVPEHFDPNYYQGLQTAARTIESQTREPYTLAPGARRFDGGNNVIAEGGADPSSQPSIQREVAYYRSIGRNDLAEQLLRNHAEGAPVVFDVNHDGAPDLVPRSYFNNGGAQPAPTDVIIEDNHGNRMRLNPETHQWEPVRNEAPAFRAGPGGAAPGQQNFP